MVWVLRIKGISEFLDFVGLIGLLALRNSYVWLRSIGIETKEIRVQFGVQQKERMKVAVKFLLSIRLDCLSYKIPINLNCLGLKWIKLQN